MRALVDGSAVGEDPQVVAAAASGVEGVRFEHHPDGPHGVVQVAVPGSRDGGVTGVRCGQVQQDLHGGGFPGSVGSEEAGDPSGADREAEVVDHHLMAISFGDVLDLERVHGRGSLSVVVAVGSCAAREARRSDAGGGGGQRARAPQHTRATSAFPSILVDGLSPRQGRTTPGERVEGLRPVAACPAPLAQATQETPPGSAAVSPVRHQPGSRGGRGSLRARLRPGVCASRPGSDRPQ